MAPSPERARQLVVGTEVVTPFHRIPEVPHDFDKHFLHEVLQVGPPQAMAPYMVHNQWPAEIHQGLPTRLGSDLAPRTTLNDGHFLRSTRNPGLESGLFPLFGGKQSAGAAG